MPRHPFAPQHRAPRDGQVSLDMGVLCGSTQQVCDDFVRRFQRLDDAAQ